MRISRQKFLHLVVGAAALPAVSRVARGQTYPTRPVHILIGFSAGTSADIFARLIGQWLSERLGEQFIIDNRPGVGSNLATDAVVKAPPDGYTLLEVSSANAVNAALYNELSFNFIRDISPVASLVRVPGVMEVNPSFPAKTVPEFIAYAKANPGKINMASGGIGSIQHAYGELFKAMAGVDMLHIPYPNRDNYMPDLLGGQVQVVFSPIPSSIEYIRTGKLRALAVTTATRTEALPDIPTLGDFVPGYEASAWYGVGAPKNTAGEIVDKLNKEINAGLADPKIQARLADFGGTPLVVSPADFAKLIADDTEKWGKVIRDLNIKAD